MEGDEGASRGLVGTLEQFFMRLSTSFGSHIDYKMLIKMEPVLRSIWMLIIGMRIWRKYLLS